MFPSVVWLTRIVCRDSKTMGHLFVGILLLLIVPVMVLANETSDDIFLHKIIDAYQIKAYVPKTIDMGAKERLGQALFFDPIVSGPRTMACATCHVRSKGSADGLSMAVGVGAKGVGEERLQFLNAMVVPRNALPFFNRGMSEFTAFFWDGKIQMGPSNVMESPLGTKLPKGFDSLLAVAAVFPMAEPDEMLGRSKSRGAGLSLDHGDMVGNMNDPDNYQERTLTVFKNMKDRLLGGETPSTEVHQQYLELFRAAYPGFTQDEFSIAHVGNALAAYITVAFRLKSAPWDRYVSGDHTALTPPQKRGAKLFYGKARCTVCHSGQQFSDFKFHSIAIPQLSIGKHGVNIDYGRAGATSWPADRFKFRTPPLRNVVQTGPWGHNGAFTSLRSIIEHHINPIPVLYKAQLQSSSESQYVGQILAARSPLLAEIAPLSSSDIDDLLEFLDTLTSSTVMNDMTAIPENVPSGNSQFLRL